MAQMKLNLPQFNPSAQERQWVGGEVETARFIRSLWNAAGRRRRDPGFVSVLVRCGWTNVGADDRGWESTRAWRNANIANYLRVEYKSDAQLAEELSSVFPRLRQAEALVNTPTGITHYYKPLRPETLAFVDAHAQRISAAFALAASKRLKPAVKIERVVNLIVGLGPIRVRGLDISPLNGLTPTLACLDPYRRFPIMNDKTRRLLRAIGQRRDADGAVALSKLIGSHGVRNSFELDVYAATQVFSVARRRADFKPSSGQFRDVGLKSETASLARIAANRLEIRKLHNQLTNRFCDWLLWQQIVPKESGFDAVILDWKEGRHLLIEAKTASSGLGGRMQIRQAIGQLFDYRYTYSSRFPPGAVDLAILLPSEPADDIQRLLKSLGIEILWFERTKLRGTIEL
jgi:hypothetical protein